MDTCYPIRKADGKDYDSLETLLNVLRHEPDGWWLASSNRQWHGGIHISHHSAPESVLTSINADKAVPLQCIASGNVVAWRINKNYCTAPYDKYQLRYSSTFLLVRSEHKPNPDDQSTWLTFYTLYMHLAPVSAYPALMNCYRVKPNVNSLPTNEYNGREISGQKLPKAGNITLKENDLLVVSKQETFKIERETRNDVFGLAQRLKDGKVSEEKFWVSLQDKFVEQTAPRYHRMPEWMTKAVEQGKYDTVVIPEEKFAINAGDAVGFLAEDNAPDKSDLNRVEVDFYSHIEVISVDTNMPGFLSNPKGIKTGRAFVKIKEGKPLYQRSGEGAETTFTPTNDMTKGMNAGRILPRDKTNQIEAQGTTWFQLTADNWIKCEDVDELSQHDLSKLGFTALEEASTDDFGSLLKENFLKGIFDWVSQSIRGDTEFECQQGSETYKKLVKIIDQNNDGNLSQYELAAFERRIFEGLHSGENNAPELVRRLIVKHDSEWFGDSKHKHWQSFLNNDSYPKMMPYLKKWRDDMAWMSEVPEFKSGKPVWHFHPVEFLDAISSTNGPITINMILAANLGMNKNQCDIVLPYMNKYAIKYKINDDIEIAHLLSQIGHESQFKPSEEGLSYSAKRMREFFGCKEGKYDDTRDECVIGRLREKLWTHETYYARNPVNLGNYVYAKRLGNDNEDSGDGYKYRGRGMIQLTGKDNYHKFTTQHNANNPDDIRDFVKNPDLLTEIEYAVESAFFFWCNKKDKNGKSLRDIAKTGSVLDVTLVVNGGKNGYNDRDERYSRVSKIIKEGK
ncbi:glycoside hydrolase family 19 protein [Dickeya dadantii]|uniref:glycoside hydrolase family 19 protein n=1 Tax=Dickeya dadantii TaxID=204038 RepID=UPI001495AD54|nr:glycoside hydrolase family 19 protein [Dickeya dadantii]NPE55818.1 glycoside hydrolase family 19 protein [Dickeya dadantii]NPE68339.1 glycoside hydrolase family 19 protein [Dickeya dadantii]